jgi:hypothetical protein
MFFFVESVGISESRAGSVGIRERLLSERRERAPPRHTAPEDLDGCRVSHLSGGDGGGTVACGGARSLAGELRRRAGDLVELVAGGCGAPEHELRHGAGASGGERASEEGELAAEPRVDPAERPMQ